jgi:hypothetical protein
MRTQEDAVTAKRTSRRVRLVRSIRELGSYSAIVLMLPGGTLIALSLWMLRHRTWLAARARRGLATLLAFAVGLIFPR